MGDVVTALCGAMFPVTRSPKPGSPVCATCQELMTLGDRGELRAAEVGFGSLLAGWGRFLEEAARYLATLEPAASATT